MTRRDQRARPGIACTLALLSLGPLGPATLHASAPLEKELETSSPTELEVAPTVFEGFVYDSSGRPASGALVVTSAGGKAVVDDTGFYRLDVGLASGTHRVHVTAVGRRGDGYLASTSVATASSQRVSVPPLSLATGSTCPPQWLPTFGN